MSWENQFPCSAAANENDEARMPNDEGMTKSELAHLAVRSRRHCGIAPFKARACPRTPNSKTGRFRELVITRTEWRFFRHSSFGIILSLVILHSSFLR